MKEVLILVEKQDGAISIKRFKDKSGNLLEGDIFQLNGVAVADPAANELLIAGKDFVHAFNLTTHKFRTSQSVTAGSGEKKD